MLTGLSKRRKSEKKVVAMNAEIVKKLQVWSLDEENSLLFYRFAALKQQLLLIDEAGGALILSSEERFQARLVTRQLEVWLRKYTAGEHPNEASFPGDIDDAFDFVRNLRLRALENVHV